MISFTLTTQMPSGKNQIQYGKGRRYPNARFVAWRKNAAKELVLQLNPIIFGLPLQGHLWLVARYTPGDAIVRDATGMLDALFHLLEYCGIVKDDSQVKQIAWQEDPIVDGQPSLLVECGQL